ncbi:hypothetical protein [Gynuella sp.]
MFAPRREYIPGSSTVDVTDHSQYRLIVSLDIIDRHQALNLALVRQVGIV